MANSASQSGQLMRAGVRTAPFQRKKKKKFRSRYIHESSRNTALSHSQFIEQGQDEIQKNGKKGRVYLVTIIEEGLGNSKDKNYYSADALKSAVQLFNGAKAYADHPDAIQEKTLPERSMKDLVGWYSDCFVDQNPETGKARLNGKLHFFPTATWLTHMIDTILQDPSAKGLFGISINAVGKTRQAEMNGEIVNYVESFQRVDSADVVTEPAARGKFLRILESRRGAAKLSRRKVSNNEMGRVRESRVLSSEKAKELGDSLTAAYHSDNPDEMKDAMYGVVKELYAASSISGKGTGQVNEEQYSNINPASEGESEMKTFERGRRRRVKASGGFRPRRRLRAATGTGPDNIKMPPDTPEDIESRIEEANEADVENENDGGDMGQFDDFAGSDHRELEARGGQRSRRRFQTAQEGLEDEGFEDEGAEGLEDEGMEDEGLEGLEDEGFEDEGAEDENVGGTPPMSGGMSGGGGAGAGAPMPAGGAGGGGGAPMHMSAADDGDDDGMDDDDDGDGDPDDELLGEAEEEVQPMRRARPGVRSRQPMMASRGRRRGTREADTDGFSGFGKAGHKTLPKGADPTQGYGTHAHDEEYGPRDDNTNSEGLRYKIKTSVPSRNRRVRRFVRKVVHEANRRIMAANRNIRSLRESNRAKDERIAHLRGILSFHNSKVTAKRLCESAVHEGLLPEGYARVFVKELWGLPVRQQERKIEHQSRLLETTREAFLEADEADGNVRLVEGHGGRGIAVSRGPDGGTADSGEGLASYGIPMKGQSNEGEE